MENLVGVATDEQNDPDGLQKSPKKAVPTRRKLLLWSSLHQYKNNLVNDNCLFGDVLANQRAVISSFGSTWPPNLTICLKGYSIPKKALRKDSLWPYYKILIK